MAFRNDAEFQDDFRKVGQDVTAGLERPGFPSDPTGHASSENLDVAGKTDDLDDDDLEDDEDEDLEDDEDEDDLDDEDLEDEEDEDDLDEDEDEDDDLEDDDLEDEDEDEDDDELEDDDDTVKARLRDAETRARAQ